MALTLSLLGASNTDGDEDVLEGTYEILGALPFDNPTGDVQTFLGGVRKNRTRAYWQCVVVFDQFTVESSAQDFGHLQQLLAILRSNHVWIVKDGTTLTRVNRNGGIGDPFNYWTDTTDGILSDTLTLTKKVTAQYSLPSPDFEHGVDNFTVTFEEVQPNPY